MELSKILVDVQLLAASMNTGNQEEKIVKDAAQALGAKLQILIESKDNATPLTESEKMQLVVSKYIKRLPNGASEIDGMSFRGDIPPSVLWDFYKKITQANEVKISVAAAKPEEEKKSLPPLAVTQPSLESSEVDAELAQYDEAAVAMIMKANDYIKQAATAKSIEKATRAVSNVALMAIARAADLVAQDEINLADNNGLGIISRAELSLRVFNYYHSQNNTNAGQNENTRV
jgi:hypothetical protein